VLTYLPYLSIVKHPKIHLFLCPARPTQLTAQDVSNHLDTVADFLDLDDGRRENNNNHATTTTTTTTVPGDNAGGVIDVASISQSGQCSQRTVSRYYYDYYY